MNPHNAGVGAWLLRRVQQLSMHIENADTLEQETFAHWQAQQQHQPDVGYSALLTLFGELWQQELTDCERAVLHGLHVEEKTESAVARALGLHHSQVGRIRRCAQGKLEQALGYVMRYRDLMQQEETGE
ncbi:MAG: hypothetical protein FWB76_02470 [Oscillospiraceae bacterium]|nr:hypothetical protein [Oscillospiraceae bacterium]